MIAVKATPERLSLVALALMLLGFAVAHVDDGDALLYGRIADNIVLSHDWFHLYWTASQITVFNDHLPPGLWLVAIIQWLVGHALARLVYGGMAFLTWYLMYRLAKRHGLAAAGAMMLVLVAVTESYLRYQPQTRIDPPLLLAWVLALFTVGPGTLVGAVVAGVFTGIALLIKPPVALALFVLVPAAVLVERARLKQPLGRPWAASLLTFVASALVLPVAFVLLDRHFGAGDWPQRYWSAQVLASLTGSRPDGQASHLAPLGSLFKLFWPGLPLLLLAAWFSWRDRHRLPALVAFLWLWTLTVIVGLSLGHRHLAHHLWPAYPALMLLAAIALTRLANETWPILVRWAPVAARIAVVGAAGFAVVYPWIFTRSRCDVAHFADLGSGPFCPTVTVFSTSGARDWGLGNKIVDHLNRDVYFNGVGPQVVETGCEPLIAAPNELPAASHWQLLYRGSRTSFFTSR